MVFFCFCPCSVCFCSLYIPSWKDNSLATVYTDNRLHVLISKLIQDLNQRSIHAQITMINATSREKRQFACPFASIRPTILAYISNITTQLNAAFTDIAIKNATPQLVIRVINCRMIFLSGRSSSQSLGAPSFASWCRRKTSSTRRRQNVLKGLLWLWTAQWLTDTMDIYKSSKYEIASAWLW